MKIKLLKSQSEKYKVIVRKSNVPKMDWKEKKRLKQLSEQFWVAEKTYKGGRGAKAPCPPLYVFAPKILRTAA